MKNQKRLTGIQFKRCALLLPLIILPGLIFTVSKAGVDKNQPALLIDTPIHVKHDTTWNESIISGTPSAFKNPHAFGKNNNFNKALIIVDGKLIPNADLKNIDPARIDSTTIISSTEAVKLYGNKAKYGAIVIKLKTGKPKN